MSLDLRIPMGLLFLIIGGLLTAFGAYTHGSAIYEHSAGMDINLIWGIVMLIFGATMFLLGWRANKMPPPPGPAEGKNRPLGGH